MMTSRSPEKFIATQGGNTLKTPFTGSTLGGHKRRPWRFGKRNRRQSPTAPYHQTVRASDLTTRRRGYLPAIFNSTTCPTHCFYKVLDMSSSGSKQQESAASGSQQWQACKELRETAANTMWTGRRKLVPCRSPSAWSFTRRHPQR